MEIEVTSGAIATVLAEAERAGANECCGLLRGTCLRIESAVPTANVHPEPSRHFEIDPAALIAAHKVARAGGPALLGYFHSHPRGPAKPSVTDQKHATGDGMIWAIAAPKALSFWCDSPAGFTQIKVIVVD